MRIYSFKMIIYKCKFDYLIVSGSPDGTYGLMTKNGSWAGIVGVLQRREADMTISDLSLTPPRAVVCFLNKFNTVGSGFFCLFTQI
jgi:hypothetical protein